MQKLRAPLSDRAMSHWWSMVICDWVPSCLGWFSNRLHRRAVGSRRFPSETCFALFWLITNLNTTSSRAVFSLTDGSFTVRACTWNMVFLTNFLGVLKLCWFQFHLILYRLAPLCPTYFPMQTVGQASHVRFAMPINRRSFDAHYEAVGGPLDLQTLTCGTQGLLALGILRLTPPCHQHPSPAKKDWASRSYAWFQSRCSVHRATPMHMLLLVPPRKPNQTAEFA